MDIGGYIIQIVPTTAIQRLLLDHCLLFLLGSWDCSRAGRPSTRCFERAYIFFSTGSWSIVELRSCPPNERDTTWWQDATGIKFLTATGIGTGIYYFFNRNRTRIGISLRKIDRYRDRNRYEEYIFTPL